MLKKGDFTWGFLGCCIAWSMMELSKHLYMALKAVEIEFGPITRLRYSLFTVLYPTGISCEIYCIFYMRQEIVGLIWGHLKVPNSNISIEISYNTLLIIVLLLYVPSM